MRVRSKLTLIGVLLWLVVLAAPALAADRGSLVVRDPMLDTYPRVKLSLIVPSALLGDGADPRFSVEENGRTVEVLDVTHQKADPIDVLLVIDESGSMKGDSMAAAKNAAVAFVGELAPGLRASLIAFADRPRLLAQLTSDTAKLKTAISGLNAGGETALYDSLELAANEASRAESRRPIVVVLSDGGDTVSRIRLDGAMQDLQAAKAPVLVVALPSAEADFETLRSVARQTGGRFANVSSATALVEFYKGLARELQTSWQISYISKRPSTKDLDVVVSASQGSRSTMGSIVLPNPIFSEPVESRTLDPIPPASIITLVVAALLVFGATASLITAVALLVVKPKTGLDNIRYYDQLHSENGDNDSEHYTSRVTDTIMGAVEFVSGKQGVRRYVYQQLERANLPLRPTEYVTIHLLAVIASGIVIQLVTHRLLVSILVVVLITLGPIAWVEFRIGRRKSAFVNQLADVLNLLASSLRAGWGLQQAVDMVVEQMQPPVSSEFRRAQTEIRLGRPVESALQAIADRMDSDDFAWAVTAIGIQREVGGNLAEVLDVVATTIRDRAALRRQISALTAEGRLSAWILMLLPFVLAFLLMVLNPAYMVRLFTTGPGLAMFAVGVVLLIIGGVWMSRTVKIEV